MKTAVGILASIAIVAPTLVSAQGLHEHEYAGRTEARAMVGISIPLGHGSPSEQTAPRVDFSLQSGKIGRNAYFDHDVRKGPAIGWRPQRKSSLALTLQDAPRLMMNGRRVATFGPAIFADDSEEDKGGGGDTALYVLGGLVLLGGLTAIVVEQADEVFEAPLRDL